MQIIIGLLLFAGAAWVLWVSLPRGNRASWIVSYGGLVETTVTVGIVAGLAIGFTMVLAGVL